MLLPGLNTLLSIIVIKKYYMLRDETVAWLVSHSIIQSFSPACVNRLQKTTHVFEFFCVIDNWNVTRQRLNCIYKVSNYEMIRNDENLKKVEIFYIEFSIAQALIKLQIVSQVCSPDL